MTDTPNLGLALIAEAQTQKHVAANEAFARIDAAAQLSVESRAASAPPAAPEDGARWLIPAEASGDFAGHEGRIAAFDNGGWLFLDPKPGWRVWVADEADLIVYDGTDWTSVGGADLSSITELGVNASPDSTNRLTVKSDAALFSHDDVTPGSGDARLTLNKAAPANTASLVFQSNWSGRAELGLAGADGFSVKVSADGGAWLSALTVDPATGEVSFPNTVLSSVPPGGATGQVLAKSSIADGDADWINLAASLPAGGAEGQVLAKSSIADGDADWINLAASLPAGGAEGQVLAKSSAADGDAAWVDAPSTTNEFGDSPAITTDYIAARGVDMIANGTGLLGNTYNWSDKFVYDPAVTPSLPGAYRLDGYYPGLLTMTETIAVDPNQIYRLSAYARQEGLPGDWSAYPNGERHTQYMGLVAYDLDGNQISAINHMRLWVGGVDSLTTLTAPLAPGDTTISVANAAGWGGSPSFQRGVMILEYKNSYGAKYNYYSRLYQTDLYDEGDVDKTSNVITLNKPFPTALGNPDDAGGVWPVGTRLANTNNSGSYKYSFFAGAVLPATDAWFRSVNYIGGVDASGRNTPANFAPGTARVKVLWLPSYSHRAGGSGSYPDTGPDHSVWFAGVSVTPTPYSKLEPNANGSQTLKVPTADPTTGALSLQTATSTIEQA